MNSLHVLIVERDPGRSEKICAMLGSIGHIALPAYSLNEAGEALSLQTFDAVLLNPSFEERRVEEFRQRYSIPIVFLSEPFEPVSFVAAAGDLARAQRQEFRGSELPVFELEEFQDQVGHDPELAAEIIDLFLLESGQQLADMRDALARRDYAQLRTLAHTIKGSLGSLHAARARARAQQLETAAAEVDGEISGTLLQALEADLGILKPQLLSLRNGGQT
jgi:HPt (histidine-containing phosphotransfer) domain-containing protein